MDEGSTDGVGVAWGWSVGGLSGLGWPSGAPPISLQDLSGATARGYQGPDRFTVVKGCLRQICYMLKAPEAGWILRPSSVPAF